MAIGFPAIMANMAAPVGSAYTLRIFSDFGEPAIAASAIIDRVTPVAFGVVFALTASVGPIIGQNYGARLMERVRRTLTDSFILSIGYVLFAWAVLALAAPALVAAFDAKGESAEYVAFYCRYGVSAWIFLGCLFVANRRSTISAFQCVDGVQLGARDARDDSIRDDRRALRRSAGRPWASPLACAVFGLHRGCDRLWGDLAAREGDRRGRPRGSQPAPVGGARKRPESCALRKRGGDMGEA